MREALQELQHDGLVVIEPYVGAHVAEIDAGLIEEIFALLEALEIICSQHACQRMVKSDFTGLEQMLRKMDELVDDLDAWSQANVEWHRLIAARAELALAPAMMDQMLDQWQRLRRHCLEDVFARRVAQAQAEHWELLVALHTRNPAEVATLIRAHNRHALDAYLEHLTRHGYLQTKNISHRRHARRMSCQHLVAPNVTCTGGKDADHA